MDALERPLLVGVGPVLVDQYVHCDDLPEGPDLPQRGSKLQATSAEHMADVRKKWVEGWTYESQVGGPVFVALRQAQRLGARIEFAATFGSDDFGELIREATNSAGFETTNLICQHGRHSGSAIVWIDRHGERSILFDSGSLDPLDASAVLPLMDHDPTRVHIDSREALAAKELATQARQRNIGVHYDIDPWNQATHQLLTLSTSAQVSVRELTERNGAVDSLEQAVRMQHEYDLEIAIVTLGERGVVAAGRDGKKHQVSPYPAREADSTGAGDAFAGAFSYFHALHADVRSALFAGCVAGSYMASYLGNEFLADIDYLKAAGLAEGHPVSE